MTAGNARLSPCEKSAVRLETQSIRHSSAQVPVRSSWSSLRLCDLCLFSGSEANCRLEQQLRLEVVDDSGFDFGFNDLCRALLSMS